MLLPVTIRHANFAHLLTPLHSRSFNEWPLRTYQRGKPKYHLLQEVHVLSSNRTAQFSDVPVPFSTYAKKLTIVRDVKHHLQHAAIAKDGLKVLKHDVPFHLTQECIIVPRSVQNWAVFNYQCFCSWTKKKQELQADILCNDPICHTVTPLSLYLITYWFNTRIINEGISAKKMWTHVQSPVYSLSSSK